MKKKIVQVIALIIFCSSLIAVSTAKPKIVKTVTVVEPTPIVGAVNQQAFVEASIEESEIETVKEPEEIEEVEVISEPLVFPDAYFNPETEEYREEEYWDDMELVALVCQAEAEGESELGKRLVIDTIFNRMDSPHFPNDIKDIVYAEGQYECVANGRINKVENNEYIASLVMDEYSNRTNSEVIYFKTEGFFSWGTPIIHEGSHYFNGR